MKINPKELFRMQERYFQALYQKLNRIRPCDVVIKQEEDYDEME